MYRRDVTTDGKGKLEKMKLHVNFINILRTAFLQKCSTVASGRKW